MSAEPGLLAAAPWVVALPLAGAALAFLLPRRAVALGSGTTAATVMAATALLHQVWNDGPLRYPVGGWGAPLGIDLYADGLSALMIAVTAAVGLATGLHARRYFREAARAAAFWPLWLLLWAALNALFLAADAFNLYVTLELMGLAAVALVALAGSAAALRAAMRYLLAGLIGSLAYLLGVALLYGAYGTLDLALLGQRLAPDPPAWTAMGLMGVGLLLKTALFPFHFWLPPAHAGAPAPVSALLSALVVKASFYLLLRLWWGPFAALPAPAVADLLGLLGAAAVLWGSLRAFTAERLKLLVAYSTVAQLGYLFLAFPLARDGAPAAWAGALYLALSHALAKAGAFLAAGTLQQAAGHDRIDRLDGAAAALPVTLFAFALAAVSLIGLPPSGGFLGKWLLLTAALDSGQWWWAVPLVGGSLLAAAYCFRVLEHAIGTGPASVAAARDLPQWSALALAAAAVALGFAGSSVLALAGIGTPLPGLPAEPAP